MPINRAALIGSDVRASNDSIVRAFENLDEQKVTPAATKRACSDCQIRCKRDSSHNWVRVSASVMRGPKDVLGRWFV